MCPVNRNMYRTAGETRLMTMHMKTPRQRLTMDLKYAQRRLNNEEEWKIDNKNGAHTEATLPQALEHIQYWSTLSQAPEDRARNCQRDLKVITSMSQYCHGHLQVIKQQSQKHQKWRLKLPKSTAGKHQYDRHMKVRHRHLKVTNFSQHKHRHLEITPNTATGTWRWKPVLVSPSAGTWK